MLRSFVRFFVVSFWAITLVVCCFSQANAITTTKLISVNIAGSDSGNGNSFESAMSSDARFVAFASYATDVTALSTGGFRQIYVRDFVDGTTTLVSANSAGTAGGNGDCDVTASMSTDGRYVAYTSSASNLVTNDTNGTGVDVFVRDLLLKTTTLISVNQSGTGSGNNSSVGRPSLSAGGRYVAFQSQASDLVATDTNGNQDIFVRDVIAGVTSLVSANTAGTNSGNGASASPVISSDGSTVAFESSATNLVSADTNNHQDVFEHVLLSGTTKLVSINAAGTDSGNGAASNPAINSDGAYVAFQSVATNLVLTDTNGLRDVFVRNMTTGTTSLVSVNKNGTDSGDNVAANAAISGNGLTIAFQSVATNLVTTDTNGIQDVFVRILSNPPQTKLVSAKQGNTDSGNGISNTPVISRNGNFVAFQSAASNLVATDTNGVTDMFVRWIGPSGTILKSINGSNSDSGNNASPNTGYSVNDVGDTAFDSGADNLGPVDLNATYDVYLRTSYEFLDDVQDGNVSDWTFTGKGTVTSGTGEMHATTSKKMDGFAPYSGLASSFLTDVRIETAGAKVTLHSWYIDKKNNVELVMDAKKSKWTITVQNGGTVLAKQTSTVVPINLNQKYYVTIAYLSSNFYVFVNGTTIFTVPAGTGFFGNVGFGFNVKGKASAPAAVDFGGFLVRLDD